jgi:hypothetical protein
MVSQGVKVAVLAMGLLGRLLNVRRFQRMWARLRSVLWGPSEPVDNPGRPLQSDPDRPHRSGREDRAHRGLERNAGARFSARAGAHVQRYRGLER